MRTRSVPTRLTWCAALSALLLTLTACGGTSTGATASVNAAATGSVNAGDEQLLGGADAVRGMQDLYKAAKNAGRTRVTVYGPGEPDKKPLYDIFAKRFPGITVNGVYLVGPDYSAKMQNEMASGQHVADLVQAGDTSVAAEVGQNYFEKFAPVTAAKLDKAYQDPTGTVLGASATAFGYMYNTTKIKAADAPKGWQDLVDPKFRGMMASDNVTNFGAGFSTLSHILFDGRLGADYPAKVAAQGLHFESQTAVAGTAVATGQYAIQPFYPLSFYMRDKKKGAPVGFVFPTADGVHLSPHFLGVVKGAQNPDAAKLLMTWLFSPEGQQAAAAVGYYPLMPGEAGPSGYPAAAQLDLFKPFPLETVNKIANSNLSTVQSAFKK